MKKLYVLFLFFISLFANAQEPFITTWQVQETSLDIVVPIVYSAENSYTINFGDGTVLTDQQGPASHAYTSAGTYTVTLSGDFSQIQFGDSGTPAKLKTIEQWGDIEWTSMESAFKGCFWLLIDANDVPDLSQVTNASRMFEKCNSINQPLNGWDVSNITNMSYMFAEAINFNQPLSNWDVSSVTSMQGMFFRAKEFDQPLNSWVVSNVTDMQKMFSEANEFDQPLNNWDVSGVTNMREMFEYCFNFNQSLESWDVSNVTDMQGMFSVAAFNQPLNNWNVSNVTNMGWMFFNTPFNQALNNWDVSSVANMQSMFGLAFNFNQSLDNWDVSNVTNMEAMFSNAEAFNQPLNDWDVSNVTNMSVMFEWAYSFNQPLNEWDVSNVTEMSYMFSFATAFNQPLTNWDVSNVLYMAAMFNEASAFNQDISMWDFHNSVNFFTSDDSYGFVNLSGLDTVNYDALLQRFMQLELEDVTMSVSGLTYCNFIVHEYLINELNWQLFNDEPAEECIVNTITGTIRLDADGNSCDSNDIPVSMFLIQGSGDSFIHSTITSAEEYNLTVFENSATISLLNVPNYLTVSPATSEITFEGFGNEEILNFCLTANETVNDLNITLLPLEEARPGFETDYQILVQNMGTQTVAAATVSLTFDDTLQSFVSADPVPASATANALTFDVSNLQPFEIRTINLMTELFTPPTVNGGEVSAFTATVTPNNDDYTPADNTFVLEQEVVNSYDPNDKRVLQGERIYIDQADEYLNYIIRFQNTGTASAITVRIEDLLHENLDWTTFTPLSASHDYRVEITEGNQVEFIFEDIDLPHEAADAAGSNGFIAYKIKPVVDIQVGDVMEGNASIFFDYNLPIITNVATTEVIAPIEVTLTQTEASCNGESDGSASVEVEGGSGEYTYEWSDDEGNAATADGLAAGEYTVTITDSYGDSITIPVTITQPGAMAVTSQPANSDTTTGNDASFSVTASNVEDYQWQVSTDGDNWSDIENGGTAPTYSGAGTANLGITNIPFGHDGYAYRVQLENGDECISYSDVAVLDVANSILAVNDDFSGQTILEGTGGTAGDVTLNDMFNGVEVDDAAVTIAITNNGGLTGAIIDEDGNLMVPAAAVQGTYTVGYSICDALDAENCSTATAVVAVSAVSGTEDFSIADIVVYPNPATNEVYIRIPENAGGSGLTVTVHDINGRKLVEQAITGDLEKIDISGFASGTYFFTVASDSAKLSKRIVKM